MTFNSLTENEERDIPAQILKTIFGLHVSVIFRPKYVWFHHSHLWSIVVNWNNCLYYSPQVDQYSHHILLAELIVYIIPPE